MDLKVDPEKQKAFSLEQELQVSLDVTKNNRKSMFAHGAAASALENIQLLSTASACAETAQQRRYKQLREQACTPLRRRVAHVQRHQLQHSMDLDAVLAACTSNDNAVRKQAELTITAASKSPEILSQLMQRLQGGEPQVLHRTAQQCVSKQN